MNTIRLLPALLFASTLAASAAVSPIRIDVDQKIENKAVAGAAHGKAGAAPMAGKSQNRELTIKVSNNSAESFSNLTVKYWFFGRDMASKSHDEEIVKQGERKLTLAARARETVQSESVASTYVEEHMKPGNAGGKGGGGKVAASGQKLTGYAVQVVNDGNILADYYSEESIKRKLAGDNKKPAGEKK